MKKIIFMTLFVLTINTTIFLMDDCFANDDRFEEITRQEEEMISAHYEEYCTSERKKGLKRAEAFSAFEKGNYDVFLQCCQTCDITASHSDTMDGFSILTQIAKKPALTEQHITCLKKILFEKDNYNIDHCDTHHKNALYYAIEILNVPMVEVLIEFKANIRRDIYGKMPSYYLEKSEDSPSKQRITDLLLAAQRIS